MVARPRVFLLSPARLDGERGRLLFQPATLFPSRAHCVRAKGAPSVRSFSFVSGLYFRGKLAYANQFARAPEGAGAAWMGNGALVITQNRGIVPVDTRVCLEHLEAFASTDIHASEPAFTKPFARDARLVADALGKDGEVVLLGSIASAKYVDALVDVFGDRLLFPGSFVGRGDMSRGGLLLRVRRCEDGARLRPVKGATRHGPRPPKLAPRRTRSACAYVYVRICTSPRRADLRMRATRAPHFSFAFARSPSRVRTSPRGGSAASRRVVVSVISATARSNASTSARPGARRPLTLRTYWSEAAWISSGVDGGGNW